MYNNVCDEPSTQSLVKSLAPPGWSLGQVWTWHSQGWGSGVSGSSYPHWIMSRVYVRYVTVT